MYSLLVNIPHLTDATSWYRAARPLGVLRKQFRNIQYQIMDTYNWATCSFPDAAFFQRPFTPKHWDTIQMVKSEGMKVWIDYDDLLTEVPTDNPTYSQYSAPAIQEVLPKIISSADVLTVSTKVLKEEYSKWNKNIVVIPNSFDFKQCNNRPEKMTPRMPILTWRGSKTHDRDLMEYARVIIEVQNSKNPEALKHVWQYIGTNPWFITNFTPHERTVWAEPMDPKIYLEHLMITSSKAMHVPLHDSKFNRAKSNIAWIEASYAGMATICPDWEEWRNPGSILYKTPGEYRDALYAVVNNEIDVEKQALQSWEYISEMYNLEKWNLTRAEVLAQIFNTTVESLR